MRLPALLKTLLLGLTLLAAPALAEEAVPLDANGRVPVGFKGDDAEKIYDALAKLPELKKDQFESYADYVARIDKIIDTIQLPGGKTLGSRFAFVIDQTGMRSDEYDAESHTLQASVAAKYGQIDVDRDITSEKWSNSLYGLVWGSKVKRMGNYSASNAFGSKVSVAREEVNEVWIGFNTRELRERAKLGPSILPLGNKGGSIEISPEKAREAVGNLRLVILAHAFSPYYIYGEKRTSPTIQYPHDEIKKVRALYVSVDEVWFYNEKNGEIYKKIVATGNVQN